MQFDYPDANVHAERRANTTTPIQKLYLLNHPFVLARATSLQKRISSHDHEAKIVAAYQVLFGREPLATEVYTANEFLSRPSDSEFGRWEQLAQALLASNEFLYVD